MEEVEEWKDCIGYEGILKVNNKGEVKRYVNNTGKWINKKFRKGKRVEDNPENAYQICRFLKNGVYFNPYVHVLVAEAFLPKTKEKRVQVDHKDENRANNCVSNLQWTTEYENTDKLPAIRKSLREAITSLLEEQTFEEIKTNLRDNFEDSDIFNFDEQFGIAYKKVTASKTE